LERGIVKGTIEVADYKKYFGFIFLLTTILYVIVTSVQTKMFWSFGLGYYIIFYLPKILPITLFGLYLFLKPTKLLNQIGVLFFVASVVAVPFFVVNQLLNIPMALYFQEYNWFYPPIIEWAGAFALCWLITYYKTSSSFFSMLLSTQVIVAGGFLYELPVGAGTFFSTYYPLCIATPIVCFGVIAYLLAEKHWHPTKIFYILLLPFFAYLVFYPFNIYFNIWVPRLPTILLLATLPFGFQVKEHKVPVMTEEEQKRFWSSLSKKDAALLSNIMFANYWGKGSTDSAGKPIDFEEERHRILDS
jgi:hypothetical protein